MPTLYLPDLRNVISRFATGTNPDSDQVASSLQDRFASLQKTLPGKWNKVRGSCLAAAMCYPIADKEQLCVTAEWIILLFAWDDLLDGPEDNLMDDAQGANKINNLIISIFDHPETSEIQAEISVVAAVRAFWARFRATSSPTIQKRFVDAVRQYAQGTENLMHNRGKGRSPSIGEFIAIRRATSGVETCLAGVEYSLGIEVPDEAFYHAAIQELRDDINDIIAWTNDAYSFNKEQAAGDYQNLVAVVAIEKNTDVQSAIEFVFIMIQSAIDHYFEARARLPKFDLNTDELVSRYVRGIEHVCSGFVLWHFEIDRYFGSKVGEVEDRVAVKVLPREKGALEPGFQLRYNTPATVIPSIGNEESISEDVPHPGIPESLLQKI